MNSRSAFKALPVGARTAIALCAFAGATAIGYSILSQDDWNLLEVAFLMALSVATARAKVQVTRSSTLSFLTATVLLSLMLAGTGAAVLVALCGVVTQTFAPGKKTAIHQFVFNASMIAITVSISGWVYESSLAAQHARAVNQLVGMLLAALVYFLGNSGFIAAIIGLSQHKPIVRTWMDHFAHTAPSFLIAGMVSLAIAELLSTWDLLFVIIPFISLVYYSSIRLVRSRLEAI